MGKKKRRTKKVKRGRRKSGVMSRGRRRKKEIK